MVSILRSGQAGTVESNDILITLHRAEEGSGICIDLTSPVIKKYGRQIKAVIQACLQEREITDARVVAADRGALDCTVRARMMAAIDRAAPERGSKG